MKKGDKIEILNKETYYHVYIDAIDSAGIHSYKWRPAGKRDWITAGGMWMWHEIKSVRIAKS